VGSDTGDRVRGKQGLPPEARIRRRAEFARFKRPAKRIHTKNFILVLARPEKERQPSGPPRLGIVASRKVGRAVRRNRVKRLIREFFRTHRDRLPRGLDLLVIARPAAAELDALQTARELAEALIAPTKGRDADRPWSNG
jgi:ribonuclease P protein component